MLREIKKQPFLALGKTDFNMGQLDSGFDIRWGDFKIYLILPAALGAGVNSASNRNEYQKQKNNVCGE
jgi:hypothetical protein